MASEPRPTVRCPICRELHYPQDILRGDTVRPLVVELIRKTRPEWGPEQPICFSCMSRSRTEYVARVLEEQRGDLSQIDAETLRSLREQEALAIDVNERFDSQLTYGERLADRVAEFGGSWGFIIGFGVILVAWITINTVALLRHPFDPYPYILLNLVLSCLAAIQAPVIMMSQNRQEAKDRLHAEHDYQVNLKAELEIRQLHWKLDQLLTHQWQKLLQIQQIQTDLMEELVHKPPRGPAPAAES
ncbi:MAG: DUF1003 domain-containing protein [Candidatus Rokubacteria bacterium]|nr:DUF1003 domain-containing protein [Candidatus Rokubacteria bacterium]